MRVEAKPCDMYTNTYRVTVTESILGLDAQGVADVITKVKWALRQETRAARKLHPDKPYVDEFVPMLIGLDTVSAHSAIYKEDRVRKSFDAPSQWKDTCTWFKNQYGYDLAALLSTTYEVPKC